MNTTDPAARDARIAARLIVSLPAPPRERPPTPPRAPRQRRPAPVAPAPPTRALAPLQRRAERLAAALRADAGDGTAKRQRRLELLWLRKVIVEARP